MSDWNSFTDRSYLKATDVFVVYDTDTGTGVNVAGAFVAADSSGNYGVGTTSPAHKLDVLGAAIRLKSTTGVFPTLITDNPTSGAFKQYWRPMNNGTVLWEAGVDPSNTGQNYFYFYDTLGSKLVLVLDGNVRPGGDNDTWLGDPSHRFNAIYLGTSPIITSDEREKREIGDVPDEWLDAWGDVQWQRFKMKNGARWHIGLIAQRVHAAFKARGLDAFEIGLCCFDGWEGAPSRKAVKEKRDKDGNVTVPAQPATPAIPAGDRWGLRYDECLAMEAAWHRRETARQAARIEALEAKLAA